MLYPKFYQFAFHQHISLLNKERANTYCVLLCTDAFDFRADVYVCQLSRMDSSSRMRRLVFTNVYNLHEYFGALSLGMHCTCTAL